MNFGRLFVVFLIVTLLFGAIGAAVGGLIGAAASTPVGVYGGTYAAEGAPDPNRDAAATPAAPTIHGVQVGVGTPNGRGATPIGAAVGAGFGLLGGSVLGIVVALADAAIRALRNAAKPKTPTA